MLASLIEAIVSALLKFLGARIDKAKADATLQDAAVAKAETSTEEVLAGIADEQKQIDVGGSADDLAKRLRSRVRPSSDG